VLGPALLQLLAELDQRRDRQTPYEAQLHQELLVLAALAGGAGPDRHFVRPDASIFVNNSGQGGGGFAGTVVGSGGGGGSGGPPRLQINCTREGCPNKEFK
jgi:hypothetical protein